MPRTKCVFLKPNVVRIYRKGKSSIEAHSSAYLRHARFCGHQHQRGAVNCPAYGKRCGKCGGRNHFAAVCRSRVGRGRLPIRAVDNEDGWNSYVRADEDFDVLTLTLNDHVVGENTEVHGIEQMRQRSVSTKLQLDNKWVAFSWTQALHVMC